MKINDALDFFKNLLDYTNEKSEIKIYQKFIAVLSDLKNRNLTDKQQQKIEDALDELQLSADSDNSIKPLKQKLTTFIKFLKDEFSLISEGYYTAIGIALGVAFGAAFGAAFKDKFGPGDGLIIGMMFGLMIGAIMDSKAKKQNRVLKTKLK